MLHHALLLRTSSEVSQSQKDNIWFHFHKVSKIVKFIETEIEVVSRDWEEKRNVICLTELEFQFCKIKKFWRLTAQQRKYT